MRGTQASRGSDRLTVLALVAALVLAGGGLGATDPATAAFPGRNGRIAFESDRGGDFEIFTMNPDGTRVTQLTKNAADERDPAWSPDGTRIAFTSDRVTADNPEGDSEIFTVNADGTRVRQLTKNAALELDPAWSPDGKKIAFGSDRDDNWEVYTMSATGGANQTNRTNHSARDWEPAWSPDGTKLAFASDRTTGPGVFNPTGDSEIFTMNPDGTGLTQLTFNAANEGLPNWSPDGKKIAFISGRDGNAEVYTMSATGADQTNLTNNPAADLAPPAWSPDGTKIAFASDREGGNWDVYTMRADGSDPTRRTRNAAIDFASDWQPKRRR